MRQHRMRVPLAAPAAAARRWQAVALDDPPDRPAALDLDVAATDRADEAVPSRIPARVRTGRPHRPTAPGEGHLLTGEPS